MGRWASAQRDITVAYLRPWRRRTGAVVAVALVVIVLVAVVVVLSPRFVLRWDLGGAAPPADRAKAVNDIRASLLQGLAGIGLLFGVVFTWRQIQVTRQGNARDGFATAVQHMGGESIDLRVAGIYALESVAVAHGAERDAVVDVLSSFVRRHAALADDERRAWVAATELGEGEIGAALRHARPDIDVALRVLARRAPRRGEVLHLDRLAVPAGRLEFARLANADLHYSDLRLVDLQGAALRHADLTGSNLTQARVTAADLRAADLRQVLAGGLVAEGADLRGADLSQAYLAGARLGRARLGRADLRGAQLIGADLSAADLKGALADDTTAWPAGFDWRARGVVTDAGAPPLRPTDWSRPAPSAQSSGEDAEAV
ncbi:pentapeptide repeat-containing protein [Dactylosporangium sp. NPDC051541]|uniref:pentapeptide repeat-containing protein n=1 Tax=Dactylosporangium sp. NPDC051541 TaxID=3363977 RepID=UPI0037AEDCAA